MSKQQHTWKKLVTRESTLLERTLRFEGYKQMLPPPFTVKLKDLLAIYQNGMTTQYIQPDDLQAKLQALQTDYKQIGFKKITKYCDKQLAQLQTDTKTLVNNPNPSNWELFRKSYQVSRAIILYSYYLAAFIKQNHNDQSQINILQQIYDDAEAISSSSWQTLQPFFKNTASKLQITIQQLMKLTHFEFTQLLQNPNSTPIPDLENREQLTIMRLENYKTSITSGPQAQASLKTIKLESSETQNKTTQIKGQIANKGQAIGTAKIVLKKSDYSKIQTGDILITQMTHPDMLPILHKVAGIITDEGGILCHAAIISRELNKPCVIATKVATQNIQDHDQILLDANTGSIANLTRSSKTCIEQTQYLTH